MINNPKVGDVVYFNDPSGWSPYFDTHPSVRYQITELPIPDSRRNGENIPVRLRHLQTGEIPKYDHLPDTGIWVCWLARDEFLTAAYHAQKERKRATRAKTA